MKKSVTLESEHQDRNHGSLKTPEIAIRTSSAGIKLIPQPSNDSQDPLTWTALKKTFTTLTWCLGAFVSTASGLGNALGYFFQAKFYHKDAIAISYSVVATTAAIAVGPLITTMCKDVLTDVDEEDPNKLGRDYSASGRYGLNFLRLALLYLLIGAQFGYNPHPMIAKDLDTNSSDRTRIAEVGIGTVYVIPIFRDVKNNCLINLAASGWVN